MDYIVIGLLIVLTSLVSAVLYACCVMSGKIDKLAEQRNVNEELEELKKKKNWEIIRRKIMEKIAKEFQNNHKKGVVSNITSYSFKYTETTKNGSVIETVYMKSYFMEV